MVQTTFFEIIIRLDAAQCGRIVVEDTRLVNAIKAINGQGVVVGARVAGPPAIAMEVRPVTPFQLYYLWDVMIVRQVGPGHVNFEVSRNVKAANAVLACMLCSTPNLQPVGVRMVGGPVGPFKMNGKEL